MESTTEVVSTGSLTPLEEGLLWVLVVPLLLWTAIYDIIWVVVGTNSLDNTWATQSGGEALAVLGALAAGILVVSWGLYKLLNLPKNAGLLGANPERTCGAAVVGILVVLVFQTLVP